MTKGALVKFVLPTHGWTTKRACHSATHCTMGVVVGDVLEREAHEACKVYWFFDQTVKLELLKNLKKVLP